MKIQTVASLFLLSSSALAQSLPSPQVSAPTLPQAATPKNYVDNALAVKADTTSVQTKVESSNGILTTPLLIRPRVQTSTGLMAWALTEGLIGPGFPTALNADPTGSIFNGPLTVRRNTNGEGHRAGGVEVALNIPNHQGCSNGGFYENPWTRGVYGQRDIVAGCFDVTAPNPIVTGATATFTDDPANTNQQSTAASTANYTVVPTGQTVKGTKATLSSSLTAQQVAQLTVGMVVETDNAATGALTSWDPNGTWIKVDTWVLIASDPVLVGYNPANYGGTNITINTVSQIYGLNANVTIPANAYRQHGNPPNGLGAEITMYNNAVTVTRNEFDSFNDSPRVWGVNVGAGGSVPAPGGSGFITLGNWDKGYAVYSTTGYAGYLYGAQSGTPGEGAFVTQQNGGRAFVVKPANRNGTRTFSVDVTNGAITSGLSNTRQTVEGTLWGPVSNNSTSPFPITPTGNPVTAVGNSLVIMSAGAAYTLFGTVSCTDGTSGFTVGVAGTWMTNANAGATVIQGWTNTLQSSYGAVTGWIVGPATDGATWSPVVYFQGAIGVSCTGHITTMQIRG